MLIDSDIGQYHLPRWSERAPIQDPHLKVETANHLFGKRFSPMYSVCQHQTQGLVRTLKLRWIGHLHPTCTYIYM